MLKKFTLLLTLTFVVSFTADMLWNTAHTNPTGAPAGHTGSPADGLTCGSSPACHNNNNPTINNDILISNIPSAGYTPGQTYTFQVSFTGSGNKGFQVSPQRANGQYMGTLINTTTAGAARTQIVGTKYITHGIAQSSSTASWTFNWTAPAAGSGPVTFYGAYVAGRFGIHGKAAVTFAENLATSVQEQAKKSAFNIYPNPVREKINLDYSLDQNAWVVITVYDITGKKMFDLLRQEQAAGDYQQSFELSGQLSAGMYFLTLDKGSKKFSQKFLVR